MDATEGNPDKFMPTHEPVFCGKYPTEEAAYEAWEDGLLDVQYGEYIMNNCHGERVIGNGDALILAMESGYLLDSFIESITGA